MAPQARKKKADKVIEKAAATEKITTQSTSTLYFVAAVVVGCIAAAYVSLSPATALTQGSAGVSSNVEQLTVRFVDAGSPDETIYGVNTTLARTEFEKRHSSFYDARDGKALGKWDDVRKAAARLPDRELVLFKGPRRDVPSIRNFMWPADEIGRRFVVADVPRPSPKAPKIELEVLSENPRVFYVHNFMTPEEADKLIARALDESNPYKIAPSTVGHKAWNQGARANTAPTRTSENAFDVDSPTAMKLKDRAWKLLRLSGNYDESMVDGIQVLRYKLKQAYIPHMDSFDVDQSEDHNWNPSKGGTNRFATLLLYLSDVDEGGQTVFRNTEDHNPQPVPEHAASLFKKGTWELDMVQQCYSKLAPAAKKGSAVLFYSQDERGNMNQKAIHGGCPVLNGTKWAANLWFWNQCRFSQCKTRHRGVQGLKPKPGQLG